MKKWRSRTNTMAEFKIVEIVGRRMRKGKEECQVQWAVTWEPVDEEFRKGELYQEFIEDLKESGEAESVTKESVTTVQVRKVRRMRKTRAIRRRKARSRRMRS